MGSKSFRYGMQVGEQKRDVSGVSSRELVALIRATGYPGSLRELALCSGVQPRLLSRIFGTANIPAIQPFTSLLTADRLLTSVGISHRLHELTIIPALSIVDAREMAKYEFIVSDDDDNEVLTGTREQYEARAQELMALRDALIGDELRVAETRKKADYQRRVARKKKKAALAA